MMLVFLICLYIYYSGMWDLYIEYHPSMRKQGWYICYFKKFGNKKVRSPLYARSFQTKKEAHEHVEKILHKIKKEHVHLKYWSDSNAWED